MVFLVTKAALAATIVGVGVTFGALSYLARRSHENSTGNNGLLSSSSNHDASSTNRGFPSFSLFPTSKEPTSLPSHQGNSASLFSFPTGRFRLFGTSSPSASSSTFIRDCNCKVIHECSIGTTHSFRLRRTCGFQGFQRKICCDEPPLYFSTPPPHLALDEVKSAHAHLSTNFVSCQHNHDANGNISGCNCDHFEPFNDSNKNSDSGSGTSATESILQGHKDDASSTANGQDEEERPASQTASSKTRLNFPSLDEYFKDDKMDNGVSTQVPLEIALFPDNDDDARGRNDRIDDLFGEEREKTTERSAPDSADNGDIASSIRFPKLEEYFPDAANDRSETLATSTTISPTTTTTTTEASIKEEKSPTTVMDEYTTQPPLSSTSFVIDSSTTTTAGLQTAPLLPSTDDENQSNIPDSTFVSEKKNQDDIQSSMGIFPKPDYDDMDIIQIPETTTTNTALTSKSPINEEFPDVTERIVHGGRDGTQGPQSLEFEKGQIIDTPHAHASSTASPVTSTNDENTITTASPELTTVINTDMESSSSPYPNDRRPFALSGNLDEELKTNDFHERVTIMSSELLKGGEMEPDSMITTTEATNEQDKISSTIPPKDNSETDPVSTILPVGELMERVNFKTTTETFDTSTSIANSQREEVSGNNLLYAKNDATTDPSMVETTTNAPISTTSDSYKIGPDDYENAVTVPSNFPSTEKVEPTPASHDDVQSTSLSSESQSSTDLPPTTISSDITSAEEIETTSVKAESVSSFTQEPETGNEDLLIGDRNNDQVVVSSHSASITPPVLPVIKEPGEETTTSNVLTNVDDLDATTENSLIGQSVSTTIMSLLDDILSMINMGATTISPSEDLHDMPATTLPSKESEEVFPVKEENNETSIPSEQSHDDDSEITTTGTTNITSKDKTTITPADITTTANSIQTDKFNNFEVDYSESELPTGRKVATLDMGHSETNSERGLNSSNLLMTVPVPKNEESVTTEAMQSDIEIDSVGLPDGQMFTTSSPTQDDVTAGTLKIIELPATTPMPKTIVANATSTTQQYNETEYEETTTLQTRTDLKQSQELDDGNGDMDLSSSIMNDVNVEEENIPTIPSIPTEDEIPTSTSFLPVALLDQQTISPTLNAEMQNMTDTSTSKQYEETTEIKMDKPTSSESSKSFETTEIPETSSSNAGLDATSNKNDDDSVDMIPTVNPDMMQIQQEEQTAVSLLKSNENEGDDSIIPLMSNEERTTTMIPTTTSQAQESSDNFRYESKMTGSTEMSSSQEETTSTLQPKLSSISKEVDAHTEKAIALMEEGQTESESAVKEMSTVSSEDNQDIFTELPTTTKAALEGMNESNEDKVGYSAEVLKTTELVPSDQDLSSTVSPNTTPKTPSTTTEAMFSDEELMRAGSTMPSMTDVATSTISNDDISDSVTEVSGNDKQADLTLKIDFSIGSTTESSIPTGRTEISTTSRYLPNEYVMSVSETTTENVVPMRDQPDYDNIPELGELAEPIFDLLETSTFSPPDTHDLTKSNDSNASASSSEKTVISTREDTESSGIQSTTPITDETTVAAEAELTTTENVDDKESSATNAVEIFMNDMQEEVTGTTPSNFALIVKDNQTSSQEHEDGATDAPTSPDFTTSLQRNVEDLLYQSRSAESSFMKGTLPSTDSTTEVSPEESTEMTTKGIELEDVGGDQLIERAGVTAETTVNEESGENSTSAAVDSMMEATTMVNSQEIMDDSVDKMTPQSTETSEITPVPTLPTDEDGVTTERFSTTNDVTTETNNGAALEDGSETAVPSTITPIPQDGDTNEITTFNYGMVDEGVESTTTKSTMAENTTTRLSDLDEQANFPVEESTSGLVMTTESPTTSKVMEESTLQPELIEVASLKIEGTEDTTTTSVDGVNEITYKPDSVTEYTSRSELSESTESTGHTTMVNDGEMTTISVQPETVTSTIPSDTHDSYAATTEYTDAANVITLSETTTDPSMSTLMDEMDEVNNTQVTTSVPMLNEGMMGEDGIPVTEITKSIRREPDTDKTIVKLTHMSSQEKNKVRKTVTAIKSGSEATVSELTTESPEALYTSTTDLVEKTTTEFPLSLEMEENTLLYGDSLEIDTSTMETATGSSLISQKEESNETELLQGRTAGRGVPLPIDHKTDLIFTAEPTMANTTESIPSNASVPITVSITQTLHMNKTMEMEDDAPMENLEATTVTNQENGAGTTEQQVEMEQGTSQYEDSTNDNDGSGEIVEAEVNSTTNAPKEDVMPQQASTIEPETFTERLGFSNEEVSEIGITIASNPEMTTENLLKNNSDEKKPDEDQTEIPQQVLEENKSLINETLDSDTSTSSASIILENVGDIATPLYFKGVVTTESVTDIENTEQTTALFDTVSTMSPDFMMYNDSFLDNETIATSMPNTVVEGLEQDLNDMSAPNSTKASSEIQESYTRMTTISSNSGDDELSEMFDEGSTSMPESVTKVPRENLNLESTTQLPTHSNPYEQSSSAEELSYTSKESTTVPETTESATTFSISSAISSEISASTENALVPTEAYFKMLLSNETYSSSLTEDDSSTVIPTDSELTNEIATTDSSKEVETTVSTAILQEIYNTLFGSSSERSPRLNNLGSDSESRIDETTSSGFKTTTTPEPPFKVEVKVGPYDSRSLFSSDSTAVEKHLEGQISNVVNQLLLTTHKNFHLLPNFVECAGARGRTGRRKTKVLHFDTENYPWMARIGFREPGGVLFPCAGTIISHRYILTSAHCALRKSNGTAEVMEILLEGAKNAAAGMSDQSQFKYKVEQVVTHPNYNGVTRENDLALIRLAREIPAFNGTSEVKPICLPFEDGYGVWDSLPGEGETAYLGGWGYGLKNMAAKVEEMDDAAVTIWSNENCTYLYRGDREKKITPQHICAYGKAEDSTCRGDYGGPLMALMTRQRIFFQIGIVSHGPRCGYGVPGVYTRVSNYLSWILDTMRP